MRRPATFAIALTAALLLASPTWAKELKGVEICGAEGCATITDATTIEALAPGRGPATSPPAISSFYTLRWIFDAEGETHSWQIYYMPASGTVRRNGASGRAEWIRLGTDARAAYARATAALAPFLPPELTKVRVGSKVVTGNPGSYLRLYAAGTPFHGRLRRSRWLRIVLESASPSPWTDGASILAYSPRQRLLRRDGHVVRLPLGLARRVRHAAALG